MSQGKCGFGKCAPSWIQRMANAKAFVSVMSVFFLIYASHFSLLNANLTPLERRFQLSGAEAGTLTSINDFAIICVVIFGCYFGSRSHIPRCIAAGSLIVGVGCLLCALPHYISDPLDTSLLTQKKIVDPSSTISRFLCKDGAQQSSNGSQFNICKTENTNSNKAVLSLIVIGQILIGVGGGCIWPLAVVYIEDAVGKAKLLVYLAFLFLSPAFGALLGFVLSFFLNSLYVDFDRIEPDEIPDIPQDDPRWIGAWWFGFVIQGVSLIFVAIPLSMFPRSLPQQVKQDTDEKDKKNIEQKDADKNGTDNGELDIQVRPTDILTSKNSDGLVKTLSGFVPALKRTVCNPTLWLITLADALVVATTAGGGINIQKYLIYQYGMSVSSSSLALGFILIIQVVSHFVSASIVHRIKHHLRKCMKFSIVCRILGMFFIIITFFLVCPTTKWAGYTVPYAESSDEATPSCYDDCSCSDETFFPVCGAGGLTYTSPCAAGCTTFNTTFTDGKFGIIYNDCSCVKGPSTSAIQGLCPVDGDCKLHLVYILCFAATVLISSCTVQPEIYVMLRVSREEDRAVTLAFRSVGSKLLGTIPAPSYFGAVVNTACILWQKTCGDRGNCWLYDLKDFRIKLHSLLLVIIALAVICETAVLFTLRKNKEEADDIHKEMKMAPRRVVQKTESQIGFVAEEAQ